MLCRFHLQAACDVCSPGTYTDSTHAACVACTAGYECSDPTVGQVLCDDGYYSTAAEIACTECPAGSYCTSSFSLPQACDPGTYSTRSDEGKSRTQSSTLETTCNRDRLTGRRRRHGGGGEEGSVYMNIHDQRCGIGGSRPNILKQSSIPGGGKRRRGRASGASKQIRDRKLIEAVERSAEKFSRVQERDI